MTNKEHKRLSIQEFTQVVSTQEDDKADIAVLAVVIYREIRIL